MRVSLKAPTPGSGPASLAPDPTRDVVDEAAQPVAQATPPAPMAAPLDIAPVLAEEPQFASMNQVTSSPAPVLQTSAPPVQQTVAPQVAPQVAQAPAQQPVTQQPVHPAPVSQPFSKPKHYIQTRCQR